MTRTRLVLFVTAIVLAIGIVTPEAQGRFWVLVNGSLRFNGPALVGDGSNTAPSLAFTSAPNLGFFKNSSTAVGLATASGTTSVLLTSTDIRSINQSGAILLGTSSDAGFTRVGAGEVSTPAVAFASLGTPASGSFAYCSDCAPTTPASCPGTKASCVCTSGGVGSWAVRTNNLWYCPF